MSHTATSGLVSLLLTRLNLRLAPLESIGNQSPRVRYAPPCFFRRATMLLANVKKLRLS